MRLLLISILGMIACSLQAQSPIKYYNQSNVGFSYGLGNAKYSINYKETIRANKEWSIDAYSINGIQMKGHQLGIGLGADIWKSRWFIPIFFNYSCTFLNEKKVSPHAGFDVGYSFGKLKSTNYPFEKDNLGSAFVRPRVGIIIRLTSKVNFVAHAFYKMQSIRAESQRINHNPQTLISTTSYYKYNVYYHFLGINVGIKI